jgi:hypothetical protein
LPLIGNLHQIPSEKRHIQFEKWAREYGPIYSLMLGNKVMIVLSSDVAIKELVDRRGVIYSSRPEAYIAQDILSGGLRILFMVSSDYRAEFSHDGLTVGLQPNQGPWTVARKLSRRILGVNAARTYVPYQDLENKAMLSGLLDNPGDFIEHLRRYTASITTQMTFGFRTTSLEDKRFQEAFEVSTSSKCLACGMPLHWYRYLTAVLS